MCDKGPVNLQDSKFNDILKYKKSPDAHTQRIRHAVHVQEKQEEKNIYWTATRWQPVDSVMTREMKA